MPDTAIVGKWTAAPGARDIVTGQARYCPDIQLPGMLCGKLLYSPPARARVDDGRARPSSFQVHVRDARPRAHRPSPEPPAPQHAELRQYARQLGLAEKAVSTAPSGISCSRTIRTSVFATSRSSPTKSRKSSARQLRSPVNLRRQFRPPEVSDLPPLLIKLLYGKKIGANLSSRV